MTIVQTGGDSWSHTADYAFGHARERDTSAVVEKSGGKVVGIGAPTLPGQDSPRSCCRRKPPRPQVIRVSPKPRRLPPTNQASKRVGASRVDRTSPACGVIRTLHALGLKTGAGPGPHRGLVLGRQ